MVTNDASACFVGDTERQEADPFAGDFVNFGGGGGAGALVGETDRNVFEGLLSRRLLDLIGL